MRFVAPHYRGPTETDAFFAPSSAVRAWITPQMVLLALGIVAVGAWAYTTPVSGRRFA